LFASFAFHLIVVVPTGYKADNAKTSLLTPVGVPTVRLSVADAETTYVAPPTPASIFTFLFPFDVVLESDCLLQLLFELLPLHHYCFASL
jgi:hypothetical protein